MLRPINRNLLVRLKAREDISQGGIHIPTAAQEAEDWGVVVAVGEEVEDLAPDEVIFVRKSSGTHYTERGEDFVIIEENRVLAKIIGER